MLMPPSRTREARQGLSGEGHGRGLAWQGPTACPPTMLQSGSIVCTVDNRVERSITLVSMVTYASLFIVSVLFFVLYEIKICISSFLCNVSCPIYTCDSTIERISNVFVEYINGTISLRLLCWCSEAPPEVPPAEPRGLPCRLPCTRLNACQHGRPPAPGRCRPLAPSRRRQTRAVGRRRRAAQERSAVRWPARHGRQASSGSGASGHRESPVPAARLRATVPRVLW